MSDPKFTPGPWLMAQESGDTFPVGPNYEQLEGPHNLALILAAPDMYAALNEILLYSRDFGMREHEIATLKDLLKKARGES